MQIRFHGFGATRVLSGYRLEVALNSSVSQIKKALIREINSQDKYGRLDEILAASAFASEERIFNEDEIISKDTTINLLPPVCGG